MEPEDTPIVTYTIYERPEDYPTGFVLRQWLTVAGESQPGESWRAATLEDARDLLPPGVTKLPFDDPSPHIIESWM